MPSVVPLFLAAKRPAQSVREEERFLRYGPPGNGGGPGGPYWVGRSRLFSPRLRGELQRASDSRFQPLRVGQTILSGRTPRNGRPLW